MNIPFFKPAVAVLIFLSLAACSNDDDTNSAENTVFDGSRLSALEFYSEAQFVATESLGFALNFGDEPPDVEGVFRIEPIVLQSSTNANDAFGVGNSDVPFNLTLSNQDSNSLTIDIDTGTDLVEYTSAVISGSGNAFTIFAVVTLTSNGIESREAFSGNLTEFGIENFQFSPFVIGNEDIRLFEDLDNLSERL